MTFTTTTASNTDIRTAYHQARARYEADPTSPAAVRAMGWALVNLLKAVSGATDASPARLLRGLELIGTFPMESEDLRWRESVLWSINRFLLRMKPAQLSLADLAPIVSHARTFVNPEPSLARSVWWKALLRHSVVGIDWLGLFDELGWDGGFRPEDEQPESYGDNMTSRPLVEGLMQVVARQLLQSLPLTDKQASPWRHRLRVLASQHPDWQFLPYYHAKLLLRLNRAEEARQVFLPFARRKQRDFWVWSMLADLQPEADTGRRRVCYARALTLRTPESFLVKVRQRLAALLIETNQWDEARLEIDRLIKARRAENWPIPVEVIHWMNDERYTQASELAQDWYGELKTQADILLWEDQPETIVVVTGLDTSGSYCNFSIDPYKSGSFPCGKLGLELAGGDRLAIRYEMRTKKDRLQVHVLTARLVSVSCTHLSTRFVTGPLRIVAGRNIGFVSDVYVPIDIVSAYSNLADQLVTVEAIESWDSGKKKMGWRAFRMETVL